MVDMGVQPGIGSRSGRRTPGTGWWHAWPPPTPAGCLCRSTPATPRLKPSTSSRAPGAPLLFASGEFLGADKAASIDRDTRAGPAAHRPRPDREGRRHLGRVHGPAARRMKLRSVDIRAAAVNPTTSPTSCSRPGTTGRSKGALCAHRQSLAVSAAWAECGPDHQRGSLPLHQPVLPQLRLQGRHSRVSCRPGRR
jgi:hypothetical protein